MRLAPKEIKTIKEVTHQLDPSAEIFLYGSRVHDHLKGGDIDLLILSDLLGFKDRLTILSEILRQIGEQKLDLSIKSKSSVSQDAFVQSIFQTAIRL